jgi:hypothetical protein
MPSDDGETAPQHGDGGRFSPVYDAEEFRLAAIHIFGRIGWKKNTALAFGVTESTVYRWVSESVPIPHHAAQCHGRVADRIQAYRTDTSACDR